MASPRPRIAVTVSSERAPAIDVAGHRAQRYVEALFAELELGSAPAVEITVGAADRIAIGPRTIPFVQLDREPIAVGEAIALAIYRCRELLILPALVDELWRAWFPGSGGDAAPAEALLLVRAAVRYGLRPSRCKPYLAQTSLAGEPPDQLVERVIGELLDDAAAGVAELRLSAQLLAAVADPPVIADDARAAALGDELFRELGIVVRFAPAVLDPSLAVDECAVRCNDLSSPALRVHTDPIDHALRWMLQLIRETAGSFVSPGLVRLYLLRLAGSSAALVDEVERRFSPGRLASVLRALADEQLAIRDLRGILEGLLEVAGTTTADHARRIVFTPSSTQLFPAHDRRGPDGLDAAAYAECTRVARKRAVTWHYGRHTLQRLVVHLLAPEIEQLLAGPAAVSPEDSDRICAAILAELGPPALALPAVLLTTMDARRRLAELVRGVFPAVAVVSYSELAATATIQPVSRIQLAVATAHPAAQARVFDPA